MLTLAALFLLAAMPANAQRGRAEARPKAPEQFPHRIWAACDFEAQQYAWFGPALTEDIPQYPGNKTVMGVAERPWKKWAGIMTGINPVPGPRMGSENQLYLRYKLSGASEAIFQHFSLSVNDNNHIRLSGLSQGKWAEATMNFSRDGRRNDGSPGVPFKKGERMDDLKIMVGKPADGKDYDLLVDDIIFFSNEAGLPPEPEPFPRRVIFLAAFDTGINPKLREKYWHGSYDILSKDLPEDSWWGVAAAVPHEKSKKNWIRLEIRPKRPVGAHTKLRFRYQLSGSDQMTVQIFDATDQDNRHINLRNCPQERWTTQYLDFTKARRNDGANTPFAAGHIVDDLFFFVPAEARLLIDEVVLFDARLNP